MQSSNALEISDYRIGEEGNNGNSERKIYPFCDLGGERQAEPLVSDRAEEAKSKKLSGVIKDFCEVFTAEEAIGRFCGGLLRRKKVMGGMADVYNHWDRKQYPGDFALSLDKQWCAYKAESGVLCMNAFDAVLYVKYRQLDGDVKPNTPKNRRPSYLAFAADLKSDEMMQAYYAKKKMDAMDLDRDAEEWMSGLVYDAKGNVDNCLANYHKIFENDMDYQNLRFSEKHQTVVKIKPFEWNPKGNPYSPYGIQLTQADYDNIKVTLTKKYGFRKPSNDLMNTAMNAVAYTKRIDPVKDWFDDIRGTWDGKDRIAHILQHYFGVPDKAYYRFLSRATLLGLVARVLAADEGIQFDIVPLLYGKQGVGKTSFCRDLMIPGCYSDINSITEKDVELELGIGICELSEAEVMNRNSVAKMKGFVTKTFAKHRFVYDRYKSLLPRKCIFIITTNELDGLLRDDTGNRRFWPVMCETPYKPGGITEHERNQIFAEALEYYDSDEYEQYLYTDDDEVLAYASQLRRKFEANSEWRYAIEEYIENTGATELCAKEVYVKVLKCPADSYIHQNEKAKQLHNILRSLEGWVEGSRRQYKEYGKQPIFRKKA